MESINIYNIYEFNNIFSDINPQYLEYKGNYFFCNKHDTEMYEIVPIELGNFLCLYTKLFNFDSFVISSCPFRLYKINDNYNYLINQYCRMFKDIYNIFKHEKIKSLKNTIEVLNNNNYNCYYDKKSYPLGYWKTYTKEIPTLYIESKENIEITFPYYYAQNIRNNIIQKYFKSIIKCI